MKPNRQSVYDKFDGRCAYCGDPIEFKAMQVDHLIAQWRLTDKQQSVTYDQVHCHENHMPSCRSCNKYKDGRSLEYFREGLEDQINILRRDRPTFRLAERFGLIECKPKPIVFYFEIFNK